MIKVIRELGPLALGVVLFGLLIAWLLSTGNTIGNWLFALFLFGHGWVHAMYLMRQPQPAVQTASASSATAGGPDWPFNMDRSWLLGGVGTPASAMHLIGTALVAATLILYSLAALATIPLLVDASLWVTLIVAASITSALLMLVYFHRNLVIGLAIDAVLIWVAVAGIWTPAG